MDILKHFDANLNFWQVNPQFKILNPFKSLFENDKHKNKDISSKIMWAVAFRLDPSSDNIYRNIPDDQKCEILQKDFIKDKNFKWEDYDNILDFYRNMVLSQAEKSLLTWNEILSLRDKNLKSFYKEALENKDIDLIVDLDKILTSTPKLFTDYNKIKNDFDKETNEDKRGAGQKFKSLTDASEI